MQSKDEQNKYKSNLRNYQTNLDRYTKNLIEGCELIFNEISNKEDVNVENNMNDINQKITCVNMLEKREFKIENGD